MAAAGDNEEEGDRAARLLVDFLRKADVNSETTASFPTRPLKEAVHLVPVVAIHLAGRVVKILKEIFQSLASTVID